MCVCHKNMWTQTIIILYISWTLLLYCKLCYCPISIIKSNMFIWSRFYFKNICIYCCITIKNVLISSCCQSCTIYCIIRTRNRSIISHYIIYKSDCWCLWIWYIWYFQIKKSSINIINIHIQISITINLSKIQI